MNNFFTATRKKREEDAGLQPKPAPNPPKDPAPSQSDFFYGTPADLRKKRPSK